MRIINKNEGKNVIGKCQNCLSELEINTYDIKSGLLGAYFICPVCNKKIYIPDNKLYLFGIRRGYDKTDEDYDPWVD